MKGNKLLGHADSYSFLMLVMMFVFIIGACLENSPNYHMFDVIINFGFVNTMIAQLCTMGLAAAGYHAKFSNGAVAFLSGMNAVAAVLYSICFLTILIQIISMLKMRTGKKIAYRTPLLFNTVDIGLHIVYLGTTGTAMLMLVVKIVGEIVLLRAHRYQKKELKRLKAEAKAAAQSANR